MTNQNDLGRILALAGLNTTVLNEDARSYDYGHTENETDVDPKSREHETPSSMPGHAHDPLRLTGNYGDNAIPESSDARELIRNFADIVEGRLDIEEISHNGLLEEVEYQVVRGVKFRPAGMNEHYRMKAGDTIRLERFVTEGNLHFRGSTSTSVELTEAWQRVIDTLISQGFVKPAE